MSRSVATGVVDLLWLEVDVLREAVDELGIVDSVTVVKGVVEVANEVTLLTLMVVDNDAAVDDGVVLDGDVAVDGEAAVDGRAVVDSFWQLYSWKLHIIRMTVKCSLKDTIFCVIFYTE